MAEHDTVWTAVSALLRAQVSEAVWLSTFQDVIPLPGGDDALRLQVPNGHIKERILTRYLQLVLGALVRHVPVTSSAGFFRAVWTRSTTG